MFFFPFNVDVPMQRVPIANWVLIGLTTLLSMVILMEEPQLLVDSLPLWRGEYFSAVQLVGYVFVHGGLMHLLGNMMFLFCFGNAVNAKFGHATFLAFYFAVALLTGVAWLMFGSGPALVGASGAIMGVVGAFLVLYPRNDVSVFYFIFLFFFIRIGTFQMASGVLIAIYVAFDLWGLIVSQESAVAYIAHVVGALAGMAVAVVLLKTRLIESTRYEQTLLEILKL